MALFPPFPHEALDELTIALTQRQQPNVGVFVWWWSARNGNWLNYSACISCMGEEGQLEAGDLLTFGIDPDRRKTCSVCGCELEVLCPSSTS